MSIFILSREESIKFLNEINYDIIHIDISDFPDEHIKYKNSYVKEQLCLEFYDLFPEECFNKSFKKNLFTKKHARKIIKLIKKYNNLPVIINCYKGVSRSAAVGKFIGWFRNEDISWISPPNYYPNKYILLMLLATFLQKG